MLITFNQYKTLRWRDLLNINVFHGGDIAVITDPEKFGGKIFDQDGFYTPKYLDIILTHGAKNASEKNVKPVTLKDIVPQDQFSKMLKPLPELSGELGELDGNFLDWCDEDNYSEGDSAFSVFSKEMKKDFASAKGAVIPGMLVIQYSGEGEGDFRLYEIDSNTLHSQSDLMAFVHRDLTMLGGIHWSNTWVLTHDGPWRMLYEGDSGWWDLED